MKYAELFSLIGGKCPSDFERYFRNKISNVVDQEVDTNNGLGRTMTGLLVTKVHNAILTALHDAETFQTEIKNIEIGISPEVISWIMQCAQTAGPLRDEVSVLFTDSEIAPVFTMLTSECRNI